MMCRPKVVFSIPGRIRIHHSIFIQNRKTLYSMTSTIEDLHGVVSASTNRRTGNILVCYNPELTNEFEILDNIEKLENDGISLKPLQSFARNIKRALNPGLFLKKPGSSALLHNEYHLSRSVIKLVILVAGIVFLFKFMIKRFVAMLVFAIPIIIFAIPLTAFYYAMIRARNRRIFLKNISSLEHLRVSETVYINDSVLISGSQHENKDSIYQNLNHPEFQKFLNLNQINDLLNIKITDFVFGIRENGITDIAIVKNEDYEFIDKIAYQLGIDQVIKLQDNVTMLDFFQNHTLIATAEEQAHKTYQTSKGLVLYIYNKNCRDVDKTDISVQNKDIHKIPWLIGLSRYCNETIVRCENSAIAINSMGMLLAALGYLNPLGALSVYSINMAGQILFIKRKVLSYQKEMNTAIEEKFQTIIVK